MNEELVDRFLEFFLRRLILRVKFQKKQTLTVNDVVRETRCVFGIDHVFSLEKLDISKKDLESLVRLHASEFTNNLRFGRHVMDIIRDVVTFVHEKPDVMYELWWL